jgi:uncharacterized DUF497 family protein
VANVKKHGLDFTAVVRFDWEGARLVPDLRRDYGETRMRAFGRIGEVPCVVVYARRGGV